jgi:hypothetical protein
MTEEVSSNGERVLGREHDVMRIGSHEPVASGVKDQLERMPKDELTSRPEGQAPPIDMPASFHHTRPARLSDSRSWQQASTSRLE